MLSQNNLFVVAPPSASHTLLSVIWALPKPLMESDHYEPFVHYLTQQRVVFLS